MFNQMAMQNGFTTRLGTANVVDPVARKLFNRTFAAGRKKRRRGDRRLAILNDQRLTSRHHLGTRAVSLDRIRGTINKAEEFDIEFHPMLQDSEERWVRVATALRNGISLPPVELIQINDTYFVVDGHHRISAAKALKHTHIDAFVTVGTLAE